MCSPLSLRVCDERVSLTWSLIFFVHLSPLSSPHYFFFFCSPLFASPPSLSFTPFPSHSLTPFSLSSLPLSSPSLPPFLSLPPSLSPPPPLGYPLTALPDKSKEILLKLVVQCPPLTQEKAFSYFFELLLGEIGAGAASYGTRMMLLLLVQCNSSVCIETGTMVSCVVGVWLVGHVTASVHIT